MSGVETERTTRHTLKRGAGLIGEIAGAGVAAYVVSKGLDFPPLLRDILAEVSGVAAFGRNVYRPERVPYRSSSPERVLGCALWYETRGDALWKRPSGFPRRWRAHREYKTALEFAWRHGDQSIIERLVRKEERTRPGSKPYSLERDDAHLLKTEKRT